MGRFDHWNAVGTLDAALDRLRSGRIDSEGLDKLLCVDGMVVRAARCAAGLTAGQAHEAPTLA